MTLSERIEKEILYRASRSRFIRAWGKCEIFLGLFAAGIGFFLGCYLLTRTVVEVDWSLSCPLALIVLGGYLALAGHRGHLYQSSYEQTAFLLGEIRFLKERKETHA